MTDCDKEKYLIDYYTNHAIFAMWERIDAAAIHSNRSINDLASAADISSSTIYLAIKRAKEGTPKDTELYLIIKICEELGLDLNYAVHGKERKKRNANSYDDHKEYAMTTTDRKELIHRINNDPTAALIDMISYLPQNQRIMNTIKQDVVSHFKT